jgi:ERCC4-type nuclease
MLPETYGADVLIPTAGGAWAGVQRKEVKDLIASLDDGRLFEQIAKMRQLEHRMLLIEGDLEWSNDGTLIGRHARWAKGMTEARVNGALWTAQLDGCWITATRDLQQTVRVLLDYEKWRSKARRAASTRGAVTSAWGTADSRDYAIHLLCGLPGVGTELAARIVDAFGGVPWQWTATRDELLAIEGLGAKKVDAMLRAVQPTIPSTNTSTNDNHPGGNHE